MKGRRNIISAAISSIAKLIMACGTVAVLQQKAVLWQARQLSVGSRREGPLQSQRLKEAATSEGVAKRFKSWLYFITSDENRKLQIHSYRGIKEMQETLIK